MLYTIYIYIRLYQYMIVYVFSFGKCRSSTSTAATAKTSRCWRWAAPMPLSMWRTGASDEIPWNVKPRWNVFLGVHLGTCHSKDKHVDGTVNNPFSLEIETVRS